MINLSIQYQKVKKSLEFSYKGYPIHNILSIDIIALIYRRKSFRFNQLLNLVRFKKIEIPQDKNLLYSIGDYKRKDYYEILQYVRRNVTSNLLDLSSTKMKYMISLKNIYIACQMILIKKIELDFMSKISLILSVTNTLNTIDHLEASSVSGVTKFCSFCSNLNEEAILDYFFQKRNIETFTLQHGLWFIHEKPPIDLITYENLIANKLLCWGEYTKDEFSRYGINLNRLIVTGYPRKVKSLNVVKNNNPKRRILVLFSRVLFDSNNLKLASLLIQIKKDVEIDFKLHPSLSTKKYKRLAMDHGFKMAPAGTVNELLETGKYDCSISYNSTAYYDSYINNCISLRYKDKDADNSIDILDDGFSNLQELKKKMELIEEGQTSHELWKNVEKKLEYILGFGINNYEYM